MNPDTYIEKICPYCHTPIAAHEQPVICPSCGTAHHNHCWMQNQGCANDSCPTRNAAFDRTVVLEAAPAPESTIFCTACGSSIPADSNFCVNCGHGVHTAGTPVANDGIAAYNAAIVKKKSAPKWILPVVIGVVAVIAIVAVVFGIGFGSVELDESSLDLERGESYTLSYDTTGTINDSDLNWKSSDTSIATVDDGKITAKGVGTCKITVSTDSGAKDSCTITVTMYEAEAAIIGTWDLNAIYEAEKDDFTFTSTWSDWWIRFNEDMTGRINLGDEYDDFTWRYDSTESDGDHNYVITITDSDADFELQYWVSSEALAMAVGEDLWVYE